jgi:hypothetical protein
MALKLVLTLLFWLEFCNLFRVVVSFVYLETMKHNNDRFEEFSEGIRNNFTEETQTGSNQRRTTTHKASAENTVMHSKLFVGKFFPSDEPKRGESRINMSASLIANISTTTEWYNGSGSVAVQSGGAGCNFVVFSYEIPAGVGLYLETEIYSVEDYMKQEQYERFDSHLSTEFATCLEGRHKEQQNIEITFMAYGIYTSHSEFRTEIYSFSFDKVVQNCIGESIWYNGNGSTDVTGGIAERYFKFTSRIPTGVSGMDSYKCYFVRTMDPSVQVKRLLPHSKVFAGDSYRNSKTKYVLDQIYDTILPGSEAITWFFGNYSAGIINVEGSAEWKSGTGVMTIIEGDRYIELSLDNPAKAYGTYQCNITHLLAQVSNKVHCLANLFQLLS